MYSNALYSLTECLFPFLYFLNFILLQFYSCHSNGQWYLPLVCPVLGSNISPVPPPQRGLRGGRYSKRNFPLQVQITHILFFLNKGHIQNIHILTHPVQYRVQKRLQLDSAESLHKYCRLGICYGLQKIGSTVLYSRTKWA